MLSAGADADSNYSRLHTLDYLHTCTALRRPPACPLLLLPPLLPCRDVQHPAPSAHVASVAHAAIATVTAAVPPSHTAAAAAARALAACRSASCC